MMLGVIGEVPPLLGDWDAWTGGYYELAMQLGRRDDDRLLAALSVLADAAAISGPWHVEWQPHRIQPASWSVADLATGGLRGQVQLPSGQQIICAVHAIREDEGDDWLDLCIPLEALSRGDMRVGGFPFGQDGGPDSLAWRRPIDDWFASLAAGVRAVTGFRQAAIGFELSGHVRAESVSYEPANHAYGLVLADGRYLPATS